MTDEMRCTLYGASDQRQYCVEVAFSIEQRFHRIRRLEGMTNGELLARIAEKLPTNIKLTEEHVIKYLNLFQANSERWKRYTMTPVKTGE